MADQVDQDVQQGEQTGGGGGGLFSSGFSKIGAAMPSFSSPWGAKSDDSAANASANDTTQPIGEGDEQNQQKGGFLSGMSGGFSKLTGNLPNVSAPSFGLPWSKKDGDPVEAAAEVSAASDVPNGAENKADFLSGMSGGFSKLTGNLPNVSVPSFGLPWGKKDGEPLPDADGVPIEPQQANGKSEFLSGMSGGFSKLTGGLPSVSVPSFGLPWGKKDGDSAAPAPAPDTVDQSQAAPEQAPDAAGLNKLSSAVTGIFGVFKPSDDASKLAEDTTPK